MAMFFGHQPLPSAHVKINKHENSILQQITISQCLRPQRRPTCCPQSALLLDPSQPRTHRCPCSYRLRSHAAHLHLSPGRAHLSLSGRALKQFPRFLANPFKNFIYLAYDMCLPPIDLNSDVSNWQSMKCPPFFLRKSAK